MSRKIASEFIARFEGIILNPYHDAAGFPTRGIGELLSKEKWADLSRWDSVTNEEALDKFGDHLSHFENGVRELLPDIKEDNKIAALTSFAFNLGLGALGKSELRKMINSDDYMSNIVTEWISWRKAGGKILRGLERRRLAELALYYKNEIES